MPDLDLDTADGPTRVYELLHDARPVLLDFGEPGAVRRLPGPAVSGRRRRVRRRVGAPGRSASVTPPEPC